ncbi:hypothetical protein AwDysgo_01760 [Bacteroidales bacterium]|nr:hypothetical protein AwDysgo_01760 [Bacteroidales bacterium]
MEALLHYVWKHKLYANVSLISSDGSPITVIDPGMHNTDAGPDFFNAKIKIGSQMWVGNIEMHTYASQWNKHQHQKDKAYNSVILHVVEYVDVDVVKTQSGQVLVQLALEIPPAIKENYANLIQKDSPLPCAQKIRDIPEIFITDWKNALLTERLEKKTEQIFAILEEYKQDWGQAFYITLARNFGFGINNDAFERLARSLPLKIILKHSDSVLQVEALFFGQAGLLADNNEDNNDDNEDNNNKEEDQYAIALSKEYAFLKNKYSLQPLEGYLFKNLRIRPNNFPHIKIAQLAALIKSQPFLFSKIMETTEIADLKKLFLSQLHPYWLTHYNFSKSGRAREKNIGLSGLNIILINTLVPMLFAFGKKRADQVFMQRALTIIESLKEEQNSVTQLFANAGVKIHNAGDSQALIQLKREYCEKKKCLYCRIGHKVLLKSLNNA